MTPKKRPSMVREAAPASYSAAPPVMEIGAGAFKDQCLHLLDQVRAGTMELLITKHGVPVARVVSPETMNTRAGGFMRGTLLNERDIVSPDLEAWGENHE